MQRKYGYIYSLLGHLILFLFVILKFDFASPKINLGESKSNIFPAYIYEEPVAQNNKINYSKKNERSITKASIVLKSREKKLQQNAQKKIARSQPMKNDAGEGTPPSELIALLHAAIQKQQRYPEAAIEMQREGQVKLMFVLFPNGLIEQLKIINSSGTAVLDDAAVLAVNHALPFKGVDKYLHKPQEYQISVVFELT